MTPDRLDDKVAAQRPAATVYYDGACPVCALEMDHLAARDAGCGRLRLVDIAAPGFDAASRGFSAAALDAEIHVVDGEGRLLRGMAGLRLAYASAGLAWVLRPTGLAGARPLFDAAYRTFARHRRRISRALAPAIRVLRAARSRRAQRPARPTAPTP